MSEKSDEEIVEEFINNLKNLIDKISPLLGGLLMGLITPKIYELLSPEQKRNWKNIFPFHHGAAGMLITGISSVIRLILMVFPDENKWVRFSKKLCEILIGIGAGLAIEDIRDYNEWFKTEFK